METGRGFVFDVDPYDHSYNQRRYEALGSVSTTLSRVSQLCTYVQCHICTSGYDTGCSLPTVYIRMYSVTFVQVSIILLSPSCMCMYICTLSHLYK